MKNILNLYLKSLFDPVQDPFLTFLSLSFKLSHPLVILYFLREIKTENAMSVNVG